MRETRSTIVILEDEEMLRVAIEKKLQSTGFETRSFADAAEALEYIKGAQPKPDGVWLDYYLEGDMDGIDFMEQLNQDDTLAKIPVFVVSNSASQEKIDAMRALGAKGYFLKAENRLEDIASVVKEVVGNK